ncbi:MAG: hypothetical protein ACREXY_17110 [Gammaproteobacteria bacterium]
MMTTLQYAWTWLTAKLSRDDEGAVATEYVLLLLGVALFLIFAAMGLRGMLSSAVATIAAWVGAVGPPATTP